MLRWLVWLLLLPVLVPLHGILALWARIKPHRSLALTLRGPISDLTEQMPFARSGTALIPVLSSLTQVEEDPEVKELFVRLDNLQVGLGHAEELRKALRRVSDSGTQVTVHADELSTASYWIALGAGRIAMSPSGGLGLTGFASDFLLLRGFFDKLGIKAQFYARGKYKSMRERFTEHEMSEANVQMLTELFQDIYQQLKGHVRDARGVDETELDAVLENAPLRAQQALDAGLIDVLAYQDELSDNSRTDLRNYTKRRVRRFLPRRAQKIALLTLQGNITKGRSGGVGKRRHVGDTSFVKAVQRVADSRARAIIVRVNSPGGSALASDLMWRGLREARKKKPVFISMGNVAASGGYYVSGIGDAPIFANPTTLTGSIGVVAGKFSLEKLEQRLGARHQRVSVGPRGGYYSSSTEWTDAELRKLDEDVQALYDTFVAKMAEARGVSHERLDAVAQGRVWTGQQALANQLVDHLGGIQDVVRAVKKKLQLDPSRPIALAEYGKPTLLEQLRSRLSGEDAVTRAVDALWSGLGEQLTEAPGSELGFAQQLSRERLLLRVPMSLPDGW